MIDLKTDRKTGCLFLVVLWFICASLFAATEIKTGIYQNSPKVFLDEQRRPAGFFVDIVNAIAKSQGVTITYVFDTWSENIEKLERGEIDMLVDVSYTDERAARFSLNSIPIIESWIQVYSLPETTIFRAQDLGGKRIGALADSTQYRYLTDKLRQDFSVDYQIESFLSYAEQVEALVEKQIDLFLADRFFYFSKDRPDNVIPKPVILQPNGVYFAFRKGYDPDIIGIFDTALFSMKNDYHSSYYQALNQWFNLTIETTLPLWMKWLLFSILFLLLFLLAVVFIRDYRRTKTHNRELEQRVSDRTEHLNLALKRAEAANKAKSVFLSSMSHEIRTPLNAIIGFAQILKRDATLTHKQHEQLQTISQSGEHLLKLINNILDLSKIEAGKLGLDLSDFDLNTMMDTLEKIFRFRAEEKGLRFLVERQLPAPCYVKGDEGKLRQVLTNLLGNAEKFTQTGGIALRARIILRQDSFSDSSAVADFTAEVEDTGPGIPEEDVPNLFESFQSSKAGRTYGGTGLGLSISKKIIELMDGSITFENRSRGGSIFRLRVPLIKVNMVNPSPNCQDRIIVGFEPGTVPPRVLIVDDQAENRGLLREILEPVGFQTRAAENGQVAIEIFARWSPDIVLMDMLMPVMDGYEATRLLKSTEKGRAVPVIAVTASAFEDEEKKVMETGVDGYLRKPLRPEDLLSLLGERLKVRYLYSSAAEGVDAPDHPVQTKTLSKEDIGFLSDEAVGEMRKAVANGEMLELRALIDQVGEKNPIVAEKLLTLVKQYDYENLNRVLER
ncbi:MAG TPA: transporter substrate-binding domain-containing protein [Thermotogota bacterium]|nr:transporter substrate-binding domain-containing protein [Thermotogota bacterium]HPH09317.1 transporter substrate-binding domain-containing protein [Thermotogota bacterium]HPM19786.1 transporter substrate-binding domain-containing protein [Thermotogota bacterium]